MNAGNAAKTPKISRLIVELVSGIACARSTSNPEIIVGSPTSTTPTSQVYLLSVGRVKEKVLNPVYSKNLELELVAKKSVVVSANVKNKS